MFPLLNKFLKELGYVTGSRKSPVRSRSRLVCESLLSVSDGRRSVVLMQYRTSARTLDRPDPSRRVCDVRILPSRDCGPESLESLQVIFVWPTTPDPGLFPFTKVVTSGHTYWKRPSLVRNFRYRVEGLRGPRPPTLESVFTPSIVWDSHRSSTSPPFPEVLSVRGFLWKKGGRKEDETSHTAISFRYTKY